MEKGPDPILQHVEFLGTISNFCDEEAGSVVDTLSVRIFVGRLKCEKRSKTKCQMERILETEVMDGAIEAIAYANADFSDSNALFVNDVHTEFGKHLVNVIDLGCGPADIPIRLAKTTVTTMLKAVDASAEMLRLAGEAVQAAGLRDRIELLHARLPHLPLPDNAFDLILSKDMLHHLPDPGVLWREVKRLGKLGAGVFVMDLVRPDSPKQARRIVERVAGNEDPVLKEDFYNSLCAAFTVSEVRQQLRKACVTLAVDQVTDRHMRISGLLQ